MRPLYDICVRIIFTPQTCHFVQITMHQGPVLPPHLGPPPQHLDNEVEGEDDTFNAEMYACTSIDGQFSGQIVPATFALFRRLEYSSIGRGTFTARLPDSLQLGSWTGNWKIM